MARPRLVLASCIAWARLRPTLMILVGLALAGLIMLWHASFNEPVTLINHDRLKYKMTPAEVIAILGEPHAGSSIRTSGGWCSGFAVRWTNRPTVTELEWHNGPALFGRTLAIIVGFDQDGHITQSEVWQPDRERNSEGFLMRIRRWIGL